MKSGLKTTEFYVTAFVQIVSMAVMMGFLGKETGDAATDFVSSHVVPLIAQVGSAYAYIKSRTSVKVAAAG